MAQHEHDLEVAYIQNHQHTIMYCRKCGLTYTYATLGPPRWIQIMGFIKESKDNNNPDAALHVHIPLTCEPPKGSG